MRNFTKARFDLPSILVVFSFAIILSPYNAYGEENELEYNVKIVTANVQSFLSQSFDQPIKVAVLPFFWDKDDQWALCRVITELVYTRMSLINEITLVDRNLTMQVFANLKINPKKGILGADDTIKLKEKLDCNIFITGHVDDQNTIININTFIWDAEDGKLLTTRSCQIRKTAAVVALLETPYKLQAEHHDYFSVKWRSPVLPYKILGVSVNDIDGDETNELILITENEVKVLSWDGFSFVDRSSAKYIDSVELKRNQKYIRIVSGWDSDSDGKDEIYLSVPDVETSIWKWEKDAIIRSGTLPFTLVADQNGTMYSSFLKNNRNYFSGQRTYEVSKTDNIRTEKPMPYDFYSIAVAQTNDLDNKEWILVDVENVMRIFSDDMTQIWQGTMAFGSGIAVADLDNDKRNEIVATSALPVGDKDILIILEWDGNTYAKKWESSIINGSISALNIGDPNNDGVDELISIIHTQDGSEIYLYTANYPQ